MEDDRESLKMNHLKILVRSIGLPGSWGKGDTIEEARKIAGKPKYYEVYLVTYDTTCDFTDGGFWFDRKYPPKLIHAVLPKKKSTKKT